MRILIATMNGHSVEAHQGRTADEVIPEAAKELLAALSAHH